MNLNKARTTVDTESNLIFYSINYVHTSQDFQVGCHIHVLLKVLVLVFFVNSMVFD